MSPNKDLSKMKFSDLVMELSEMWYLCMKHIKISHDMNISYKERRKSAEEIERLISREYLIVDHLDDFFEPNKK